MKDELSIEAVPRYRIEGRWFIAWRVCCMVVSSFSVSLLMVAGFPFILLPFFWTIWSLLGHVAINLCDLAMRTRFTVNYDTNPVELARIYKRHYWREVCFSALFAVCTSVAISFWILWMINPTLLVNIPASIDAATDILIPGDGTSPTMILSIYPLWLAHVHHTFPLLTLAVDFLCVDHLPPKRCMPSFVVQFCGSLIVGLAYLMLITFLVLSGIVPVLPYPFMRLLTPALWVYLIIIQVAILAISTIVSNQLRTRFGRLTYRKAI